MVNLAVQIGQKAYVSLFIQIVSNGLASISKVDPAFQKEMQGFPQGFTISLLVHPNGPGFTLRVTPEHFFEVLHDYPQKADLTLKIKHLAHAFSLFTMQESTAIAFANGRMIADGELSKAIRFVRCLNRMEAIILPKLIANLAVKEYDSSLTLQEKLPTALRTYQGVVLGLINSVLGKN